MADRRQLIGYPQTDDMTVGWVAVQMTDNLASRDLAAEVTGGLTGREGPCGSWVCRAEKSGRRLAVTAWLLLYMKDGGVGA